MQMNAEFYAQRKVDWQKLQRHARTKNCFRVISAISHHQTKLRWQRMSGAISANTFLANYAADHFQQFLDWRFTWGVIKNKGLFNDEWALSLSLPLMIICSTQVMMQRPFFMYNLCTFQTLSAKTLQQQEARQCVELLWKRCIEYYAICFSAHSFAYSTLLASHVCCA